MLETSALFKLTYGLFLIGAAADGRQNACITNTLMQVTSDPLRCVATVTKTHFTHELLMKTGKLSVSVLSQEAKLDVFNWFGMQSGYTVDKLTNYPHETDANGCPYLTEGVSAVYEGTVVQTLDLGTHTLFLFDVTAARNIKDIPPMTYSDYRVLKSGKQSKPAEPVKIAAKWVCSVCHYEYDGTIPFEDLPDDYTCPVCGVGKNMFVKV